MLSLGRIHQLEMHSHGLGRIIRPKAESVVAQILAGLDVVLIRIRPMEFDFFTFIGNRVHAGLIHALGEEIAFRIVAAEKAVEMIVHLRFQGIAIHGILLQTGAQVLDLRGIPPGSMPADSMAAISLANSFSRSALSAVWYCEKAKRT